MNWTIKSLHAVVTMRRCLTAVPEGRRGAAWHAKLLRVHRAMGYLHRRQRLSAPTPSPTPPRT